MRLWQPFWTHITSLIKTCHDSTYVAYTSEWNSSRKSEICNPAGDYILTEVWQDRRPQEASSHLLWPNQARPFEKSWSVWQQSALKLAYLSPEVLRATTASHSSIERTCRTMDRQTTPISTILEFLHIHRQSNSLSKTHCRISTS